MDETAFYNYLKDINSQDNNAGENPTADIPDIGMNERTVFCGASTT